MSPVAYLKCPFLAHEANPTGPNQSGEFSFASTSLMSNKPVTHPPAVNENIWSVTFALNLSSHPDPSTHSHPSLVPLGHLTMTLSLPKPVLLRSDSLLPSSEDLPHSHAFPGLSHPDSGSDIEVSVTHSINGSHGERILSGNICLFTAVSACASCHTTTSKKAKIKRLVQGRTKVHQSLPAGVGDTGHVTLLVRFLGDLC